MRVFFWLDVLAISVLTKFINIVIEPALTGSLLLHTDGYFIPIRIAEPHAKSRTKQRRKRKKNGNHSHVDYVNRVAQ